MAAQSGVLSLLRMLRLARIARIMRLARLQIFGDMIMLINGAVGGIKTLFDGRPVLRRALDEFAEPGLVEARRDVEWAAGVHNSEILKMRTEAKFEVGEWQERFEGRPRGGLFLLRLPGGVEATVTGVDFLSTVITMPRPAGGANQGGYCGNFNGVAADDDLAGAPAASVYKSHSAGIVDVLEDRRDTYCGGCACGGSGCGC